MSEQNKATIIPNGCAQAIADSQGKRMTKTTWQPIATAPRNGTWILIANAMGDMAVAWDKSNHPIDDWRIGAMCIFRNPIYWQSLPEAPWLAKQ